LKILNDTNFILPTGGRRGHDRMAIWFTTTSTINAYHHHSCEFDPRSRRGLLDTALHCVCDKGCQWLATGRWFSPGILVSSTNKTDRHDIAEILLKVALNTINKIQTFTYNNLDKNHFDVLILVELQKQFILCLDLVEIMHIKSMFKFSSNVHLLKLRFKFVEIYTLTLRTTYVV
jgi:hypothetical protein